MDDRSSVGPARRFLLVVGIMFAGVLIGGAWYLSDTARATEACSGPAERAVAKMSAEIIEEAESPFEKAGASLGTAFAASLMKPMVDRMIRESEQPVAITHLRCLLSGDSLFDDFLAEQRAQRAEERERRRAEEEKASRVRSLNDEAQQRFARGDYAGAKEAAEQALALSPNNEQLQKNVQNYAAVADRVVAGRWLKNETVDAMTDDRNTVVTLVAAAPVANTIGQDEWPKLVVRCSEGRFDLYITIGSGIDSDYGELYTTTVRYRFGAAKARRLRMSIADSRDAVFFRGAKRWAQRLMKNEDEPFLVEVSTYRRGDQLAKFDLTGATQAISEVLKACR